MKKFLTIFFVSLGVIFFCIILALAYLWIVDPYNIKPFIYASPSSKFEDKETYKTESTGTPGNIEPINGIDTSGGVIESGNGSNGNNEGLTEGQKNALELVGINPAVLPSQLTLKQEQCFVAKFGQARVDEIKDGAIPSALEVLTGKDCL